MTVTVIIPAYNCEGYIRHCLDSLLSQTGASLEIIVINDGSTDGTYKVLEEYSDRITVQTTDNGGSSSARNKGIEMATGDYIMFIDADDWLEAGTIERLGYVIQETGAEVIKFRYKKVFPDGREIVDKNQFDKYEVIEKKDFKEKIYPYFISGIRLNSMCVGIFKKELIKGRQFREDMQVAEDAVFSLGVYTKAQKVVFIPDILYDYYQSGAGLTGSGAKILNKYKCNFIFAVETAKLLKEWGMNSIFTRIRVYLRPLFLTFDKVRRIVSSKK